MIFREIVTFTWKETLRIYIFVRLHLLFSSYANSNFAEADEKKIQAFWKIVAMKFSFVPSTLFTLSGAYKDFIWYFSWKLREKFRNVKVFRSFRFVISRFIEKLWKFWKISISYINSFRPRKKKKRKTSGKVFASRENPRHFTCWLEESWFPVQFIGCRTYRLNINL